MNTDPKTLHDYTPLIEAWAKERGLLEQSNVVLQLGKTMEELGELFAAINRDDKALVKDAIGDVLVTFVIAEAMCGSDARKALSRMGFAGKLDRTNKSSLLAYTASVTRQVASTLINIQLDKLPLHAGDDGLTPIGGLALNAIDYLHSVAFAYHLTLPECLDAAWQEIKNRQGKMVGGVFVKDKQ